MTAFGSAMITSPNMAKLAVTPPVVGEVRMVMRLSRAHTWWRYNAPEILAICIKLNVPSCIRAPPEAVTSTNINPRTVAYSIRRVTFSPTTQPILPPMNSKVITPKATGIPSIRPVPVCIASWDLVRSWFSANRSV